MLNYQAWEKDPATISSPGYCGSLTRVTGTKQRRHLLLAFPFSSLPISGPGLQGILLSWETQCWFVFSRPFSSLFPCISFPCSWALVVILERL